MKGEASYATMKLYLRPMPFGLLNPIVTILDSLLAAYNVSPMIKFGYLVGK
jgi:hypothetical protein